MEAVLLVACAGAIAILADRLITAARGFVLVGPIITRVTTCAVRLKCRIRPGDRLGIRCMAISTLQVAPVILRLVGQRGVAIVRRRPCVRRVTNIALHSRAEVSRFLPDGNSAIVAGRA